MENSYFEEFIGLSRVTKTICNELRPTEITRRNIEEMDIIKEDEILNENQQKLKNIMDDYYRSFLNEKLLEINDIKWDDLFKVMKDGVRDDIAKSDM